MGHGCHFNWVIAYYIFKYALRSLPEPIMTAVGCHWLRWGESCVLRCEGWGSFYLLSALSFNHCSQQNERLSSASQHPTPEHPAEDSLHGPEEGRGRTSPGERHTHTRTESKDKHQRSGKWEEWSKCGWLPEDHCSCTKSGAVRLTLIRAVSERDWGAPEKRSDVKSSSQLDRQEWEPQELLWQRIKVCTEEKCFWLTGIGQVLQRKEENRKQDSYLCAL